MVIHLREFLEKGLHGEFFKILTEISNTHTQHSYVRQMLKVNRPTEINDCGHILTLCHWYDISQAHPQFSVEGVGMASMEYHFFTNRADRKI